MIKEIQQELYTSPEVKVIEVKARQVMCTSPTTDNLGGWGYGDNDL